ncbi:MAG: helix-turn-helix transcriptional regulator [Bacteroidales bacterium]|nr:helix-turn-helix transcriptional regulator [Bacteroidales bacterium]
MDEELHIGHIIREELRRQGKTNKWFAQELNLNPRTINKLFQKQYIDTAQLLQISEVLNVDFFKYYSDKLKQ